MRRLDGTDRAADRDLGLGPLPAPVPQIPEGEYDAISRRAEVPPSCDLGGGLSSPSNPLTPTSRPTLLARRLEPGRRPGEPLLDSTCAYWTGSTSAKGGARGLNFSLSPDAHKAAHGTGRRDSRVAA